MSQQRDKPLSLVIFDCDGTLVDSQAMIHASMSAAFVDAGMPVPALDAVRRVVGLELVEAVARLAPHLPDDRHVDLAARYKQAFLDLRVSSPPEPLYDGIAETIEVLDGAGHLLAVATGKSLRGLKAVLATHGLERRFVSLQTPETAAGKPAPDMVLNALAESGADAARCVVVGDTAYDIGMARNAGVAAIGVAWGYHPPAELRAAGAGAIVERAHDLPAAIESALAELVT